VRLIYDVAHNPAAFLQLSNQLKQQSYSGRLRVVVGMLRDKAWVEMVSIIKDQVDVWYVAGLDVPRGAKAEEIQAVLQTAGGKTCYTFETVADAISQAAEDYQQGDVVLITGSFYTVAAAKQAFSRMENVV
ncbi:MAG: bifunctional tetrahydrofolate synthase/dihydrofolate synthase, partial [Gammaproteobacteria bacterium]|nr:bifunctional tetrahydrofolate synthase/dihydrofolate synthase [Gammaproteobacteria bacterium]